MYMVAEGVEATTSSSSGDGGGCFIATAAFETSMAKEVYVLCEFRDCYLLKNKLGVKFVNFYYKYSPLIANQIRKDDALRALTRACLKPLIYFSKALCK